jgi:small subunit ribosomal protein S7
MAQKKATFIPAHSNELMEKFINSLMMGGKKTIARKIVADTLEILAKRQPEKKPEDVFEFAIRNVMPNIEVRPKRVGGAIYQIPVEVHPNRQRTLAIRWIIAAARSRKGMPMAQRLAAEMMEAVNDSGTAFKKKENVRQMAKANKAFAHFARF